MQRGIQSRALAKRDTDTRWPKLADHGLRRDEAAAQARLKASDGVQASLLHNV